MNPFAIFFFKILNQNRVFLFEIFDFEFKELGILGFLNY